jgi:hypothetical protein
MLFAAHINVPLVLWSLFESLPLRALSPMRSRFEIFFSAGSS